MLASMRAFRVTGLLTALAVCANLKAVYGHVAPFNKGMYCMNGYQNTVDYNSNAVVSPLYQLSFNDWWLHKCMDYPPAEGDYLDLPAGGSFTVEIASNRAKTTLSYGGRDTSDWPDGNHYPDDYHDDNCITSPNLHTFDRDHAAGTAFAISYESDIRKVTPHNLVVFTVAYNTPWKRLATYQVPAAMPACPPGGCICAWGWVPLGCGEPNMYQQPFRCRVSGATSTTPVGTPQPPVWCEGEPDKCVKGPKEMVYWHQAEGNNVFTEGWDEKGREKSPIYGRAMGFWDGAQNDIFAGPPTSSTLGGNGNHVQPTASSTTLTSASATSTTSTLTTSSSSSSTSATTYSTSTSTTSTSTSTSTTSTTSTSTSTTSTSTSTSTRTSTTSRTSTSTHVTRTSTSTYTRPRITRTSAAPPPATTTNKPSTTTNKPSTTPDRGNHGGCPGHGGGYHRPRRNIGRLVWKRGVGVGGEFEGEEGFEGGFEGEFEGEFRREEE